MATRLTLVPLVLAVSLIACSDGGSGPAPDDDAGRIAAAFDALADSIGSNGNANTADALHHAAELVRLTGHATPVSLTIDGAARSFLAVAEQIDYPIVICSWVSDSGVIVPEDDSTGGTGGGGGSSPGGGPGECHEDGVESMRTLIAWEPDNMEEVVRIFAGPGSSSGNDGVPDVMADLPVYQAPDSAVSNPPVRYPGFSLEYLVRDVGSWWAAAGNQANSLERTGGRCTDEGTTFDWAEVSCEAATFRWEFAVTVEPGQWEYLDSGVRAPTDATGSHELALPSTAVDGVVLTVVAWTPPDPDPVPPPLPPDTIATELLDVSLEAVRDGGDVLIRFAVTNPTDQSVTFEFPSSQAYDFGAVTADGRELWRWSADKYFLAVVTQRTLEPGQTMSFEVRWTPPAISGEVQVQAELTSGNLPLRASTTLQL